MINRTLEPLKLLQKKSHFLFGARGTGKTTLVEKAVPDAFFISLLSDDSFSRLLRRPSALAEMIPQNKKTVIIDEIQKIPKLLDEVHLLIEKKKIHFLLTGSSARKLKNGGVNLLGGRAWEAQLFPLTWKELAKSFDLIHYLNNGGLPAVYFSKHPKEELNAYKKLYIKEEIQEEALVKRLDHFVRFLDTLALCNGEEINYENIANDSGVPARTVASYVELMSDTLFGFVLPPFYKTKKRKAIKRSKFYFFDVGVQASLSQRGQVLPKTELFGKAFEHFLIQEIRAYLSYTRSDHDLCYWRSTSQMEVDVVIGNHTAIEIKATERIGENHLKGLRALREEKMHKNFIALSTDPIERNVDGILCMPWNKFLNRMWTGELF